MSHQNVRTSAWWPVPNREDTDVVWRHPLLSRSTPAVSSVNHKRGGLGECDKYDSLVIKLDNRALDQHVSIGNGLFGDKEEEGWGKRRVSCGRTSSVGIARINSSVRITEENGIKTRKIIEK